MQLRNCFVQNLSQQHVVFQNASTEKTKTARTGALAATQIFSGDVYAPVNIASETHQACSLYDYQNIRQSKSLYSPNHIASLISGLQGTVAGHSQINNFPMSTETEPIRSKENRSLLAVPGQKQGQN